LNLVTRFNLYFIDIDFFFFNIVLVIHEKIIISPLKIRFVYCKILRLIFVKKKLVILVWLFVKKFKMNPKDASKKNSKQNLKYIAFNQYAFMDDVNRLKLLYHMCNK